MRSSSQPNACQAMTTLSAKEINIHSEILNLKISKSLSETHNFNKENMLSVFVDENVFEFQRGHGSETHVLNLIIKWTKHKINILYLCCNFYRLALLYRQTLYIIYNTLFVLETQKPIHFVSFS